MTIMVDTKHCSNCGVEKSVNDFHKNKSNNDGMQSQCKECRHKNNLLKRKLSPVSVVTRMRDGKKQVYSMTSVMHGESRTNLYRRWKKMRERCNNKNANNYRWYGGRGIFVCDEWNNDYLKFKQWALETGYSQHMELDRIDNDGPYSPENCRWVTKLTNRETRASYLSPEMEEKVKERAKKDGISIHSVIKNALEAYL